MTTLNMHKAPKGIFEKTMLQNMFRFCDEDECFQSFRLVCKPWRNAIETIRFDRAIEQEIFERLDIAFTDDPNFATTYFEKYFPAFKKLFIIPEFFENKDKIFPLILKNVNKLNEIHIYAEDTWAQQDDSFGRHLIEKSQKTLHTLYVGKFICLDIDLPNLTKLTLQIGNNIGSSEFLANFPQICENFENLDCVQLDIWDKSHSIISYAGENYPIHCISGRIVLAEDILDFMPFKIVENITNLNSLERKYVSQLEYIHVNIYWAIKYDQPFVREWDRYKEIFDQCTNLQTIELSIFREGQKSIEQILPDLNETNQNIWKERIAYFQSRNIRLAKGGEISTNENLRKKLAKEAGIKLRFHIY